MTYIPRHEVTKIIPNKFEAVRVLSLECRRLNDELRAREQHTEKKITTTAVQRLLDGEVEYYDARERREQERNEAMLAAAEGILEAAPIAPPVSDSSEDAEAATETVSETTEDAGAGETQEAVSTEAPGEEVPAAVAESDTADAGEAEAAKE